MVVGLGLTWHMLHGDTLLLVDLFFIGSISYYLIQEVIALGRGAAPSLSPHMPHWMDVSHMFHGFGEDDCFEDCMCHLHAFIGTIYLYLGGF
jgi:hypothetical protein